MIDSLQHVADAIVAAVPQVRVCAVCGVCYYDSVINFLQHVVDAIVAAVPQVRVLVLCVVCAILTVLSISCSMLLTPSWQLYPRCGFVLRTFCVV